MAYGLPMSVETEASMANSATGVDYAALDPATLPLHHLECTCARCEAAGGGYLLQLAAIEGRIPIQAPVCKAIPALVRLVGTCESANRAKCSND